MRLDRTIAAALALSVTGADAQRTQCVVKSQYKCSGGKSSDSPAIEEAFKKCAKDAEVVFSEGVEYNVFSPLKVCGLSNVVVRHLGNLNLPQNVTYMQEVTAKNGGSLKWFDIRGDNVSWIGTSNVWNTFILLILRVKRKLTKGPSDHHRLVQGLRPELV